jgi:histidine ammonia-lyase
VRDAHLTLRKHVSFMHRDRALDGEVQTVCTLVQQDAFRQPRTV